jgi:hypothetical protein
MKAKTIISAMLVTIGAFGIVGTSAVHAQTPNPKPMSTLVQKIAEKFGLKTADVQSVVDAQMAERKAQMEARFEQKLAEKVKSGQLTEAQKAAIIAKRKEMADWAKQNNLDGMPFKMGFGMHGHRGWGM